jgi:heme/copper-type cytochrome/quinol oxidase subunit 2
MKLSRRHAGLLLWTWGALLISRPFVHRLAGQERAPNRPEFALTARNYRFSPDRIEVTQDDLVRVTVHSEDIAYSFAVDEYRIVRRIPPGGTTTFEFRADRPGNFRFYSNLTNTSGHAEMQGQLIVRPQ